MKARESRDGYRGRVHKEGPLSERHLRASRPWPQQLLAACHWLTTVGGVHFQAWLWLRATVDVSQKRQTKVFCYNTQESHLEVIPCHLDRLMSLFYLHEPRDNESE